MRFTVDGVSRSCRWEVNRPARDENVERAEDQSTLAELQGPRIAGPAGPGLKCPYREHCWTWSLHICFVCLFRGFSTFPGTAIQDHLQKWDSSHCSTIQWLYSTTDFFSFFSFYGHTLSIWKFPGEGSNHRCSCQPTP